MQDDSKSTLRDYERDLWEMQARQGSFRKLQQVFQIYSVAGALIGVGALGYFFLRQLKIELSSEDRIILMTAGSGFAISLLSALALYLRNQRHRLDFERSRYTTSAAEFLLLWGRFETLSRSRLEAEGREFNRMSIRAITLELVRSGLISSDDAIQLEEILRFRNLLVHSGTVPDTSVLKRMTEALRVLVGRVEA